MPAFLFDRLPGRRPVVWISATLALVGAVWSWLWLAVHPREIPAASHSSLPPEAVARVGSTFITAARLREGMQRTSASDEGRAMALEEQIRQSLLLVEAERSGFTRQPEILEAWRSLVVRRFEEALEARRESEAVVTEADVEAYYGSHPEQFLSPEQRRLALIFFPVSPSADPRRLAAVEAECRSVHARVLAGMDDPGRFASLARQHSGHGASRHSGGEVGWMSRAQAARAWPSAVVDAAFTLARDGDVSAPVATDEGWYILERIELRPAQPLPREGVRDRIRRHLLRERRRELETRQMAELRALHGVEVDADRVAAVEVPVTNPGRDRSLARRPPPSPVP